MSREGFVLVTFTRGVGPIEAELMKCDQCGHVARPLWMHRAFKRFYCRDCKPN